MKVEVFQSIGTLNISYHPSYSLFTGIKMLSKQTIYPFHISSILNEVLSWCQIRGNGVSELEAMAMTGYLIRALSFKSKLYFMGIT